MSPTGRSRGRQRKVGLKRIDAAIDALSQIGFKRSTVRKTISDLLKVYGGDDGWPFIEEGYYKVVIERILEEQEEAKNDKEKAGDETWEGGDSQDDMQVEPAELLEKAGNESRTEISEQVTQAAFIPSGWKDISCMGNASGGQGMTTPLKIGGDGNQQKKRRRAPCYGWISESDDDDEPEGPPESSTRVW